MILLDTHVAFWLNAHPDRLSRRAARAIARAASGAGMGLSSISLWELAMLVDRGRIRVKTGTARGFLDAIVQTPGLSVLEISAEVAFLSTRFPPGFPKDPADRIIAATAQAHGLPLITQDDAIRESRLLDTIW